MAELIADLFISVDGFAGGDGFGPYFGYGGPELDTWIARQMDTPHVLVMGRRTYELLAPMSGPENPMTAQPKLVVSSSLAESLTWANTRVVRSLDALAHEKTAASLRTIGSLSLVRSLLDAGLVDRLRLLTFPLLAGSRGREPAFAGMATTELTLAGTEVLDGRIVCQDWSVDANSR
jgi:dihydrofolate reductase